MDTGFAASLVPAVAETRVGMTLTAVRALLTANAVMLTIISQTEACTYCETHTDVVLALAA